MLATLAIQSFRNLETISFTCSPSFNVISGCNGAGKTSLLEAIYLLARGRSFRTSHLTRMISHADPTFYVHATLVDGTELGMSRGRDSELTIKLNGRSPDTLSDLLHCLPLQLINPYSFSLLQHGPKARRQFLDWGVFHVEQRFMPAWRRYQKALKHRNAALKQHLPKTQIQAWDHELVAHAQILDTTRRTYLEQFQPLFTTELEDLLGIPVQLSYQRGWSKSDELLAVLSQHYERDLAHGHTSVGPQRCDLVFTVNHIPAQDVLSRGQQKLLLTALHLSQGKLHNLATSKPYVCLLDDFDAELDADNQLILLQKLQQLDSQIFIATTSHERLIASLGKQAYKLFHVEQGCLNQ